MRRDLKELTEAECLTLMRSRLKEFLDTLVYRPGQSGYTAALIQQDAYKFTSDIGELACFLFIPEVREPHHYGHAGLLEAEALKYADIDFPIFLRREGKGELEVFAVVFDESTILAKSAADAHGLAGKIANAIREHGIQTARIIFGDDWPVLPDDEPAETPPSNGSNQDPET